MVKAKDKYTFEPDYAVAPGETLRETMEALKRLDDTIKVVVSSGYSSDPIMANFGEYGFIGVLPKPYLIKDLKEVIKSAEHTS